MSSRHRLIRLRGIGGFEIIIVLRISKQSYYPLLLL